MRVTFDTNTLDRAARPVRFPKDPNQPHYIRVNEALVAGTLKGHFSETLISLEGIQKKDRANVFKSTHLRQKSAEKLSSGDSAIRIDFRVIVEQLARQPLHQETSARIIAALNLGMRVLKAPRIGMPNITDPDGKYFVAETDQVREDRITKYQQVLTEIEDRGT